MIGAISFIFALIFIPQCGIQVYADNTNLIGLGVASVIAFLAYRFP